VCRTAPSTSIAERAKSSTANDASRDRARDRWEPLRWDIAARRLAKDMTELLDSCRKLFGGPNFKRAGRELYDALADLYSDKGAVEAIDQLSQVVSHALTHARKVARVE
jgi:hypothetical protein